MKTYFDKKANNSYTVYKIASQKKTLFQSYRSFNTSCLKHKIKFYKVATKKKKNSSYTKFPN